MIGEQATVLRSEQPGDAEAIFQLTRRAFEGMPYSAGTEQFIVDALRAADALTLSLVADVDGAVTGHAAFSPVTIGDGSIDWYGLGPVAVVPERQRLGIGSALIREGLARLKMIGARGCVVLGNPRYYERFGFRNMPNLRYEGAPQEYFLALPLGEVQARGVVQFHPAFSARS